MQEFRGLTGLRGIAALMVFWAHMKEQLHTYGMNFEIPIVVERLFLSGGRQVDVFFVLSGFVMTLVYRTWFSDAVTGASYATFMRRRMARIYPLHAFFLVLLVLVTLLVQVFHIPLRNGLDRFGYDTLLQHLLLIHAWGPLMPAPSTWNPPSWSISIEFLAYLIFPFAMMGLLRAAKASAWPAIALLSVLGLVVNYYLPWEILGTGAVVRGLTEFFLGCAVALVVGSAVSQWLMGHVGSLFAAAVLAIAYALVPGTGFVIALACVPLLLSLCGNNVTSHVLGCKPLQYLGEISYSVYLGHFLFSSLAYRLISPAWMAQSPSHAVVGGTVLTGFIILASSFTYYMVERPARRWLSGRSS